jgi:hypothetical protein
LPNKLVTELGILAIVDENKDGFNFLQALREPENA